ncbi:MAG: CDC27 family protein, partial [Verrucomicrobiota bacterium]
MNAFALKPAGFFGWWLSLSALFLGAVWCPAQQQGGGRAPGVVADPFNETDDEDLKKAVTLYETGEYEKCLEFMEEEDWLFFSYPQAERLQARSLQKLGRYEEAANMIADSRRLSTSMEGFLILAEIFRTLGKPEESKNLLRAQGVMRTPGDRLAFGRSLLLRGAEAKLVLENYYNPVLKGAPNLIDGYLYSGELALEKHDY